MGISEYLNILLAITSSIGWYKIYRYTQNQKNPSKVNTVICGVQLPSPLDERWVYDTHDRRYKLGHIHVTSSIATSDNYSLRIDNKYLVAGSADKAYCHAVRLAYQTRKSLESIAGTKNLLE